MKSIIDIDNLHAIKLKKLARQGFLYEMDELELNVQWCNENVPCETSTIP